MKDKLGTLLFVFIIIGVPAAIAIMGTIILIEDHRNAEIIKSRVGKSVILKKDTLMILDYSSWNNSYSLENGKSVSVGLVAKSKIVE